MQVRNMPDPKSGKARLPPRWFIRLAWVIHRRLYQCTGGRLGLWRPKPGGWGTLRLITIGRRTGRVRAVIVGYFEDGPNLVTMAVNGWAEPHPPGGSTSRRIPTSRSSSPTVLARSPGGQHRATSASVCGPDDGS
jgi:hypothetical protein